MYFYASFSSLIVLLNNQRTYYFCLKGIYFSLKNYDFWYNLKTFCYKLLYVRIIPVDLINHFYHFPIVIILIEFSFCGWIYKFKEDKKKITFTCVQTRHFYCSKHLYKLQLKWHYWLYQIFAKMKLDFDLAHFSKSLKIQVFPWSAITEQP